MLDTDLIDALTALLLGLDQQADTVGWQAPPALVAVCACVHADTAILRSAAMDIPPQAWTHRPDGITWVIGRVADYMREPATQAELSLDRLQSPEHFLAAYVLVHHPCEEGVPERHIDAVDADGRLYRLRRRRSRAPRLRIDEDPGIDDPPTRLVLTDLVRAACPA